MALWDVMQSFGDVAYSVYRVLFLNFAGPVFPQPFLDFIETIDNIMPNFSIFELVELIFGYDLADLTWLHLTVGAALGVMLYSLIKWLIDVLP